MRVTDLMVGDWVSVNGLNLKVGAIHADEIGVFDPDYKIYWCSDDGLDRIDPIPLTEDILVENVFYRSPRWHYCETTTDDGFKIYVQLGCGGTIDYVRITKHNSDLMERDLDATVSIHYVHELQHLLRLVGIKKEVQL